MLAFLRSPHTFTLEGLSARDVVSLRAECEYFQLPLFADTRSQSERSASNLQNWGNSKSTAFALEFFATDRATINRAGKPGRKREREGREGEEPDTVAIGTVETVAGHTAIVGSVHLPANAVWKVTMQHVTTWVYAGIISNHEPGQNSYSDITSFGWACSSQSYVGGNSAGQGQVLSQRDHWSGWQVRVCV